MKLKDYLKREKLSQAEFSKKIKVSRPHVNQLVKGSRNPSFPLAKLIEKVTNGDVSLNDLYNKSAKSMFQKSLMEETHE